MPRNIRELLETQAQRFPDKAFLAFFDDGREFSYADVDRRTSQIANLFLSLGIDKGDTISLLLPNVPEMVLCQLACMKMGALAGPLNIHLKSAEIQYVLSDSQSRLLITTSRYWPLIRLIRDLLPFLQHVLLLDGMTDNALDFHREAERQDVHLGPSQVNWDDEAVIIYTSGTTGKPKGCLLTYGNFLSNAKEISQWLSLSESDRLLCIMPLFHVNGIVVTMLTPLFIGGSMVLTKRFSTHDFWEIISRYQITSFGSVATMLSMLNQTEYPEGYLEKLDRSHLRFALCGSAPVPREVMLQFERTFQCLVVEGYGLSEATCRVTFNPPDERRRPGSIGLPIGSDVRVLDDNDAPVPMGMVGEIVVSGPSVMKGYFRNPEATAIALRRGWLHTGDLGYEDADGFYHLVDRKSDMIIRGGENIYPREVDNVLFAHPKIREAATVGIPDELYGEEVKAFVALREGQQATADDILNFCRQRLADFKCPKSIQFLSELPKGPTGKILKRELH
jgi:long-chain acyl-CoA synthetase